MFSLERLRSILRLELGRLYGGLVSPQDIEVLWIAADPEDKHDILGRVAVVMIRTLQGVENPETAAEFLSITITLNEGTEGPSAWPLANPAELDSIVTVEQFGIALQHVIQRKLEVLLAAAV